jgi:hypothetical protein
MSGCYCNLKLGWISHFCPDDVREFLLTSAIAPSERRMRLKSPEKLATPSGFEPLTLGLGI